MTPGPSQRFRDWTVSQFLGALASGEPVPGGGTAAALAGAHAAALLHMVLLLARKRAPDPAPLEPLLERSAAMRHRFVELAEEDAAAYARVAEVLAFPRGTEEERARRSALLQEALAHAAQVPLATAHLAVDALTLASQVLPHCPRSAWSDLLTAVHLAQASLSSAVANVDANALSLGESPLREELARACRDLAAKAGALADGVRRPLEGGLSRWRAPREGQEAA